MSELFDRQKEKWLDNQQLTYWSPGAPNYSGAIVFGTPVLVQCRWNDKAELIKDNEGKELVSKAVIHPATALLREGYVALGDHTATADPKTLNTSVVYEILVIGDQDGIHDSELLTCWV